MRKIKVFTTVGAADTIETDVTTFGDLKPILSQREISLDNMRVVVGESKNELSVDAAVLPEGDFKLYLMPAKTKSGSGNAFADKLRDIAEQMDELADIAETHITVDAETVAALEDIKNLQSQF